MAGSRAGGWALRSGMAAGLMLAAVGAGIGLLVHERWPSVSAHVIAVMIGVAIGNVGFRPGVSSVGLRFAGRHVLRVGIAVLGLRLSLGDVADLGPWLVAAVVGVVALTFIGTQVLGRALGLGPGFSLLVATGYSICGASAIAAAEPFADATDEEVAYAIGLVTLCGSLAIGVLPVLGTLLGLSSETFGSWVGASVHDVGQVVAAASTGDNAALEAAIVVKLTRVAMLAPVLAIVAARARHRRLDTAAVDGAVPVRPPILPWFVVAFLAAAALRSTGALTAGQLDLVKHAETFLIGAGLVGLGSQVVGQRLRSLGGRPLVLGLASWVLVAATSLAAAQLAT